VETVGPAVVGAADRGARTAAAGPVAVRLGAGHRDQPGAAVPAQVVEAGQGGARPAWLARAVRAPDHQDTLAPAVRPPVVPGPGQALLPPDADPVNEQDRLPLPGELGLRGEARPRQAPLQRDLRLVRRAGR